ncbi:MULTISPECIES: Asp23/Gls24 family envelope stress response protein [unclassified Streptomyces]|uniref:Asp23/Gls24 family envelope stress response protein n=1 Tax=unclassified Streptomyces TaxID=2593676 RepID=UPI003823CC6C
MALDDRPPRPPHSGSRSASLDGDSLEEVRRFTGDELLTCGRTLSHAWEQARDATPAADNHLSTCPYCREATEGLAALNTATTALREQEPPSSQQLISRVMDIIRNEVRLGPMVPLDDVTRSLQIAEHTAAAVLRRAADSIPGVTTASCRIIPADQSAGVSVSITLAAVLGRPLQETAALVRHAVNAAADHALGLRVTAVDVTVIDVEQAAREHHSVSQGGGGQDGTR